VLKIKQRNKIKEVRPTEVLSNTYPQATNEPTKNLVDFRARRKEFADIAFNYKQ
jgi:hypothetical protein